MAILYDETQIRKVSSRENGDFVRELLTAWISLRFWIYQLDSKQETQVKRLCKGHCAKIFVLRTE